MTDQEKADEIRAMAGKLYKAEAQACVMVAEKAIAKHPMPPVFSAFPEIPALMATLQWLAFCHGVTAALNLVMDFKEDINEELKMLTDQIKGRPN